MAAETRFDMFTKLRFGAQQAVGEMEKTSRSYGKMTRMAQGTVVATQKFGRAMTFVAAGAGAATFALGKIIQKGAQFGTEMARVDTLLSKGVGPSIEQLGLTTLRMSSQFGKSTQIVSSGLFDAISASVEATRVTEFMTLASQAAAGGFTSTGTAVNGLTNLMNAYGKSVDEARGISDSIFIANKLGKTTFEEISAVIGRVAFSAKASGIELNELLSTVAAVTKGGIKTSEVVSGLKAALANIGRPTKDAKKLSKDLGIEFNTAALKAKGLVKFLTEIKEATGGDIIALQKLFGSVEAVNVITALTSKEGFASFTESVTAMKNGAGATEDAFNKVSRTFAFQLGRMKTSSGNFVVALGQNFTSKLGGSLEKFNTLIGETTEALFIMSVEPAKRTPEMIKRFEELSSAATSFAEGVQAGIQNLGDAYDWIGDKLSIFGSEMDSTEDKARGFAETATTIIGMAPAILAFALAAKGLSGIVGGAVRLGGGLARGGAGLGRGLGRLLGKKGGALGGAASAALGGVDAASAIPVFVVNMPGGGLGGLGGAAADAASFGPSRAVEAAALKRQAAKWAPAAASGLFGKTGAAMAAGGTAGILAIPAIIGASLVTFAVIADKSTKAMDAFRASIEKDKQAANDEAVARENQIAAIRKTDINKFGGNIAPGQVMAGAKLAAGSDVRKEALRENIKTMTSQIRGIIGVGIREGRKDEAISFAKALAERAGLQIVTGAGRVGRLGGQKNLTGTSEIQLRSSQEIMSAKIEAAVASGQTEKAEALFRAAEELKVAAGTVIELSERPISVTANLVVDGKTLATTQFKQVQEIARRGGAPLEDMKVPPSAGALKRL